MRCTGKLVKRNVFLPFAWCSKKLMATRCSVLYFYFLFLFFQMCRFSNLQGLLRISQFTPFSSIRLSVGKWSLPFEWRLAEICYTTCRTSEVGKIEVSKAAGLHGPTQPAPDSCDVRTAGASPVCDGPGAGKTAFSSRGKSQSWVTQFATWAAVLS